MAAVACCLLVQGCTQREVRGTYDVEIEIAQVPATLRGTLILSKRALDVPGLDETERLSLGDWFTTDAIDANSCFILSAASGDENEAEFVRVFRAEFRAGEVELPIVIYKTPKQRIEIVNAQFFADAMGGEVALHTGDQIRPGRISGVRTDSAQSERCLEALERFRADLRDSLTR